MKRKNHSSSHLVVCVHNAGYPASLEKRKIYKGFPEKGLQEKGLLRVKDESGDDYIYPENYFMSIHLPKQEKRIIAHLR
jgi:hypothetical protein